MELMLFAVGSLVLVRILLEPVAARIGAPLLLLFLALGMLLGEDGPGGIVFDDFEAAYNVGALALAVILLAGGLDTPIADVRRAAAPAFVLATFGVVLTAAMVGVPAAYLFSVPLTHGLLLGAVIGSTDAAATFLLLGQRDVRLRGRIRETILVESGINDPMAIFLTLTLVGIVDAGASLETVALPDLATLFGQQLGLGAVLGVAGGYLLARLTDVVRLPLGLYAPLCLAGALAIFGGTALLGGSGFLAIYLTGLMLAWRVERAQDRIVHFHKGLSWLSQILMFVMLGLLMTPSDLGATLLPAIALAMVLMFVVRPLAVLVCLTPFRFPWRDQLFVGWVGLRGAVPIFLAIIPVISPGPVTVTFFNVVVVIVIASLVLQGWTIPWAARRLRVESGIKDVGPTSV
jgi:cell volume regulation protein A